MKTSESTEAFDAGKPPAGPPSAGAAVLASIADFPELQAPPPAPPPAR